MADKNPLDGGTLSIEIKGQSRADLVNALKRIQDDIDKGYRGGQYEEIRFEFDWSLDRKR